MCTSSNISVTDDTWPNEWMEQQSPDYVPANCPSGLEHLAVMPEIFMQQNLSWVKCKVLRICSHFGLSYKHDIFQETKFLYFINKRLGHLN